MIIFIIIRMFRDIYFYMLLYFLNSIFSLITLPFVFSFSSEEGYLDITEVVQPGIFAPSEGPFGHPIVIDTGFHTVKAGFAGDELPKVEFRSVVGRPRHQVASIIYVIIVKRTLFPKDL